MATGSKKNREYSSIFLILLFKNVKYYSLSLGYIIFIKILHSKNKAWTKESLEYSYWEVSLILLRKLFGAGSCIIISRVFLYKGILIKRFYCSSEGRTQFFAERYLTRLALFLALAPQ
jgi:hypothetical protein